MIDVTGDAIPLLIGGGQLGRLSYSRVEPNGEFGGNNDIISFANGGVVVSLLAYAITGVAVVRSGGNQQLNGHAVMGVRPTLLDGSAATFRGVHPNGGTAGVFTAASFRDTFTSSGLTIAGSPGEFDGVSVASVMQAWLRLHELGGLPSARLFFGWANTQTFAHASLAQTPRVGIHGDGVTGLRFGSVHCPDGFNAGQTALNAIDAGAVQPPELVNPGAGWFHVRVKLLPARPNIDGAVGCYLNGVLVAVYRTLANMPRSHQGRGLGVVQDWGRIEPVICAGFDAGQQLAGWRVRKFESWYDLDLTL